MAKKAKAAPVAAPEPLPVQRKPARPHQLPLARYYSCARDVFAVVSSHGHAHRLLALQLPLIALCLFALPRALSDPGVPMVWSAAIRPLVADPASALAWACVGLMLVQSQAGWRLATWRVEGDHAGDALQSVPSNPVMVRPMPSFRTRKMQPTHSERSPPR